MRTVTKKRMTLTHKRKYRKVHIEKVGMQINIWLVY